MIDKEIDRLLKSYIAPEMNPEEYIQEDLETLIKELHSTIPQLSYITLNDIKSYRFARIYDSLKEAAQKAYKEHEEEIIGFYNSISEQYDPSFEKQELFAENNIMRSLERDILLRVVDNQWIDHLHNIDMLKDGIGLRAYGQKDPLIEYKKEAYDLFNKMIRDLPFPSSSISGFLLLSGIRASTSSITRSISLMSSCICRFALVI